jgi:tryptophan-rich sensory protein
MVWIVFVALVAVCAVTGAMFEPGAWYAGLTKPAGTPPAWVFGPVWTVLYLMIAVAGALLWRSAPSPARTTALGLWFVQLVLNAAWSWLCFGRHELGWALLDISALFVVIALTIAIARVWLLAPYLLWVGYASYLNWGLWRLNPG